MKFLTLNVKGANLKKMGEIISQLRLLRVDIAILTESHFTIARVAKMKELYNNILWATNAPWENKCGVTIVVMHKDRVQNRLLEEVYNDQKGRILAIRLTYQGQDLKIMGVYAPNQESACVNFFAADIPLAYAQCRPNIIGGDWNKTQHQLDRNPPRLEDPRIRRSLKRAFLNGTYVDGWRKTNPTKMQYTYWATNDFASGSRIDRIYVTQQLHRRSSNWEIGTQPAWTDHAPAIMELHMGGHVKPGRGHWKLKPELLQVPAVTQKIEDYILSNLPKVFAGAQTEGRSCYTTNALAWQEESSYELMDRIIAFNDGLREAAQAAQIRHQKKKNRTEKKLQKRIIKLDSKPRKNATKGRQLKTYKARLKAYTESAAKNRRLRGFRNTVDMAGGNSAAFWAGLKERHSVQMIEAIQDHKGRVRTTQKKILKAHRHFYKALFATEGSHTQATKNLLQYMPKTNLFKEAHSNISKSDVAVTMQKWKNGKAPGIRGVPYELYKKYANWPPSKTKEGEPEEHTNNMQLKMTDMLSIYVDILMNPSEHGNIAIPRQWARGLIKTLFKKGDPTSLANYRPLTMSDPLLKVVTGTMNNRSQQGFDAIIGEHQTGFMRGRSIHDSIMNIQSIIDLAVMRKEKVYICFLDQEKAYDRVEHAYLWEVLEHIGYPEDWITCLQNIARRSTGKIEVNRHLSRTFKFQRGQRQGDPLSCCLFNIAIEPLARKILACEELPGFVDSKGNRHKLSMYADDTAVILTSLAQWRIFKKIYSEYMKASGAKLNMQKTIILAINDHEGPARLADGVEIVSGPRATVKYLGIPVGPNIDYSPMWDQLMDKMNQKLQKMGGIARHLSRFQRVKYANQALEGILWHALRICWIKDSEVKELMNIVHRFVNLTPDKDKKITCPIRLDQTTRPVTEGGLGLLDIGTMRKALTLKWLWQIEQAYHGGKVPTWYYIVLEIMQRSSTYTNPTLLQRPWMQYLGKGTRPFPPSVKAWWGEWQKQRDRFDLQKEDIAPLEFLLLNPFWFHYEIEAMGAAAPRWYQKCWEHMLHGTGGLPAPIKSIGHLVELANKRVAGATQGMVRAAQTFIQNMPERWMKIIQADPRVKWNDEPEMTFDLPESMRVTLDTPPIEPLAFLYSPWPKKDKDKHIFLELERCWENKKIYNFFLQDTYRDQRKQHVPAPDNLLNFKRMCKLEKTSNKRLNEKSLWSSVFAHGIDRPKLADLTWGLLHNTLATGKEWQTNEGKCPACDTLQIPKHLFWDCPIAQAVWKELEQVYRAMARPKEKKKQKMPKKYTTFLLYIARQKSGTKLKPRYERWRLLWGCAMWAIWKRRCEWSFQERPTYTKEEVMHEFKTLLRIEFHSRRLLATEKADARLSKNFTKIFGCDTRAKCLPSYLD
jgi:exonuclease III